MPELGVPNYVPTATAALLASAPVERFRAQYIEPGLVATLPSRGRVLVDTASLETAIGRPITCQTYCLAERRRDSARQYQASYRRREIGQRTRSDAELSNA